MGTWLWQIIKKETVTRIQQRARNKFGQSQSILPFSVKQIANAFWTKTRQYFLLQESLCLWVFNMLMCVQTSVELIQADQFIKRDCMYWTSQFVMSVKALQTFFWYIWSHFQMYYSHSLPLKMTTNQAPVNKLDIVVNIAICTHINMMSLLTKVDQYEQYW